MKDISTKTNTLRTARARAILQTSKASIEAIKNNTVPKGDPLPIAKVAAIQAAKGTSQLIPYCHPLPIDYVAVEYQLEEQQITIDVTVKAVYKTGVEMEALTAASVAALTIYDMLKMIDEHMEIMGIKLIKKTGGKSDFRGKSTDRLKAAVLVMSDSISAGKKSDESGKIIQQRLIDLGLEIVDYRIISDDQHLIEDQLKSYSDKSNLDLVVTTGGTGLSPRDCTPEAMANVIDREAAGIVEAARAHGQKLTPYSMLSRGVSGVRGNTLIINLPGSRTGVSESMDALFPAVLHAFKMMRAGGHSDGQKK